MRLKALAVYAAIWSSLAMPAWAEVDFYLELADLPAVQGAIAVAAEGSALAAVERALQDVPTTARNRASRDRLTDLIGRQASAALTDTVRTHLVAAMTEEEAAALLDLAETPEGSALVKAAMLAALALRQEAGRVAEFEVDRAAALIESIRDND